jgi:Fe-S oxidoreductase
MVRHADLIRGSIALLEAVGIQSRAAGGAAYCCGTAHDGQLPAAEGLAVRTVEAFNALGQDVVTWCPSCQMHMDTFMQHEAPRQFEIGHITERLHARRDRLASRLIHPIEARVVVHRHAGFQAVAAADLVEDLLRLIPGMDVVRSDHEIPGHMCSAIARVPAAHAEANRKVVASTRVLGADALVTVFHSCQRLLCGLAQTEPFAVINYVSLLTRSMGLHFEDEYSQWKAARSEDDLLARIGADRIARAGDTFVRREIFPELLQKPRR